MDCHFRDLPLICRWWVAKEPEQSIFFRTLLWSTVIFFTLLDKIYFPDYNNTKIIKFGWFFFIWWVISYGLSFSGFAIHLSLVGAPPPPKKKKPSTEQSIVYYFALINSYLFTLLDRISFPDYNNTKIIKFGWKLFILWVISYGLSFSGFAINLSLVGGPPKNGTVDF